MLQHYLVFRFTCGHVGRDNEGIVPKARAFIRVAELRGSPAEDKDQTCPDCKMGA